MLCSRNSILLSSSPSVLHWRSLPMSFMALTCSCWRFNFSLYGASSSILTRLAAELTLSFSRAALVFW